MKAQGHVEQMTVDLMFDYFDKDGSNSLEKPEVL